MPALCSESPAMPMPLATLLDQTLTPLHDSDPAWRRFVSDHREVLRAGAEIHDVSAEVLNEVVYNIPRYLRTIKRPPEYEWLVLLLNDLPSNAAFVNLASVRVPTTKQVTDLYESYLSTRNAR